MLRSHFVSVVNQVVAGGDSGQGQVQIVIMEGSKGNVVVGDGHEVGNMGAIGWLAVNNGPRV